MAIYSVSVVRDDGHRHRNEINILRSALADLNSDEITVLENDLADHIFGKAQMYCELLVDDVPLNKDLERLARPLFSSRMLKDESSIKNDEEIRFSSIIRRRAEQEINYANARMKRITELIEEGRGIEAPLRKQYIEFENRKAKYKQSIENARVDVNTSLVSVNFLQIL
jgi:hypothetical protein